MHRLVCTSNLIHKIIEPSMLLMESQQLCVCDSISWLRIVDTLLNSCACWACVQTTSGAILAFTVLVFPHRLFNCRPSVFVRSTCCLNYVSILSEIVEKNLRIDLQRDDEKLEVHFLTERVSLLGECLAAKSLP